MNVLEIPFNKYLNIQSVNDKNGSIYKIDEKSEYLNHLGTIHASVLFALAEATSGEFLLKEFNEYDLNIIPVVRKSEVKYSKPGNGTIYSKAKLENGVVDEIVDELNLKQRVIIKVIVEIFDSQNNKLMTAIFDWFVTLNQAK